MEIPQPPPSEKPTVWQPDMAVEDIPQGYINPFPNEKRGVRGNYQMLDFLCEAAFQGDYDLLETMLVSGDEYTIFNGDINEHQTNICALHLAAIAGQTECLELLLNAKADPHIREIMSYGGDPEDGETAKDKARNWGHDDCVALLEKAEAAYPYGWYMPEGIDNNTKMYGVGHGRKPEVGWWSNRPGVPEREGFKRKGPPPAGFRAVAALESSGPPKEPPLPIGLLFPGQGSQYVKMLTSVKDLPRVKEMLEQASSVLGWDLVDLCVNGPEDKLEETRYCQPCMFVASMAGLEKLRDQNERAVTRCKAVAGLSLGEYTALCVAGVFTFEDCLRLVKLRGEAMQEAAKVGKQAMLSVAGVEEAKLTQLCGEAKAKEGGSAVCQIANKLFPKGFSCAGTEVAINELKTLVEGAGALQAKILKTSGAFHTSLMTPAQEKLSAALQEMLPRMKPPTITVYMNVTAEPIAPGTEPRQIVDLLTRQLTSPVLWEPLVKKMIASGINEFYEVGPMKQLKAMMKRIDQKVWGSTTNIEV